MTNPTVFTALKANETIESVGNATIGGSMTVAGDLTVTGAISGGTTTQMLSLGTPVVADVDRIVTSANMKVGTYTIAAQPDVPRNITVTATAGDTADTMGTITVAGTDASDAVISEVIIPATGSTVAGELAFKTVTAVTGAGWVIDAVESTNDTITVGVGGVLGVGVLLTDVDHMPFGMLDYTITAHNPVVGTTIAETTVDMSAGTYDGSKTARVFVTGG